MVDYVRDGEIFLARSEDVAIKNVEVVDYRAGEDVFYGANGSELRPAVERRTRIVEFVDTNVDRAGFLEARVREFLQRVDRSCGGEPRDTSASNLRELLLLVGAEGMAFDPIVRS